LRDRTDVPGILGGGSACCQLLVHKSHALG
jgi:hypothetical protein